MFMDKIFQTLINFMVFYLQKLENYKILNPDANFTQRTSQK